MTWSSSGVSSIKTSMWWLTLEWTSKKWERLSLIWSRRSWKSNWSLKIQIKVLETYQSHQRTIWWKKGAKVNESSCWLRCKRWWIIGLLRVLGGGTRLRNHLPRILWPGSLKALVSLKSSNLLGTLSTFEQHLTILSSTLPELTQLTDYLKARTGKRSSRSWAVKASHYSQNIWPQNQHLISRLKSLRKRQKMLFIGSKDRKRDQLSKKLGRVVMQFCHRFLKTNRHLMIM